MFQYSFWVALFILFGAAATKLSVIGLVYLLLCFVFLYRGSNLLTDLRKNRLRWLAVCDYCYCCLSCCCFCYC